MGKNILVKVKRKWKGSGVHEANETFITYANKFHFEKYRHSFQIKLGF